MPRFEINVDPCDHITSDAIGAPGQRVFYIQAFQDARAYSIVIEKIQLQSLSVGIEQFLAQLSEKNPDLPEASSEFSAEHMHIHPPLEPVFRAGEIGLGYDTDRDLVMLVTREIVLDGEDPEQAAVIRFWCTRSQAWALARWGVEVVKMGRPICPQCGQPIEAGGHFCPKKNGYRH
ncbi:MAG: DUF3090 domain-containing protein [Chloroflexota bacterium]